MKKKNGFTLVELLATMVILGILMAVTIPNVVGILSANRTNVYIDDAKRLISNAKYKMTGNNGVVKPGIKDGKSECIVMSLGYLDNAEFENPPNGGVYDRTQSFVVVKREGKRYKYFVRLSEKLEEDTDEYNGIDVIEESSLEKDDVSDVSLSKIKDVNVIIDSIDKNYFINATCKCGSVIGSYFRTDD